MTPNASRLLEILTAGLRAGTLTQNQIEKATGVHQSQVSRILAGQTRRFSRNVEKLCKYAETLAAGDKPRSSGDAEDLQNEILRIWNGSAAHARALQDVLSAIDSLQCAVLPRS